MDTITKVCRVSGASQGRWWVQYPRDEDDASLCALHLVRARQVRACGAIELEYRVCVCACA